MWDNLTPSAVDQHLKTLSFDEERALVERVQRLQPDIDQLVASYAMQGFEAVGIAADELAELADEDSCCEKLQEKRVPLEKRWWMQLLAKIVMDSGCPKAEIDKLTDRLWGELPSYHIELTLMRRVGERLLRLMTSDGTSEIVQTLFADDIMTRWYKDGVTYLPFNSIARETLRFCLARTNAERLRVLEVGAGTGGLTSHVLDQFDPAATRYVFTDVGPYFLRAGRRRFSKYAFVEFAVLDLEQPCSEQGFRDTSFDLVIANNVIHDTRNILDTLRNLAQVTAPGGMLLMLELTDPQTWWHLCFGSLDGWWRFKTDPTDRRQDLMILKKHEWLDILGEAGYRDTAVLSDRFPCDFANRLFLSQIQRD